MQKATNKTSTNYVARVTYILAFDQSGVTLASETNVNLSQLFNFVMCICRQLVKMLEYHKAI